jgi:hypothetical protein
VTAREKPDEGLEELSLALRRLPTPMPPAALVERVRRQGHLELADRADEKVNRLVVGFVIFFAWTLNVFVFAAVRLLSGESLLRIATGSMSWWSAWSWSTGYFVAVWLTGVAMLVVLGVHVRRERGLA